MFVEARSKDCKFTGPLLDAHQVQRFLPDQSFRHSMHLGLSVHSLPVPPDFLGGSGYAPEPFPISAETFSKAAPPQNARKQATSRAPSGRMQANTPSGEFPARR